MPDKLKNNAPVRSTTDVGPGDYVKIGSQLKQISSNTAHGAERAPRSWTVQTTDGGEYGMLRVNRYAKAEDFE